MSALADITDEHEAKTGRRQEGIFYSARTFFAKTSNAIGHVVAGIAIYLLRFPPGSDIWPVGERYLMLFVACGTFCLGVPVAVVYGYWRRRFIAGTIGIILSLTPLLVGHYLHAWIIARMDYHFL